MDKGRIDIGLKDLLSVTKTVFEKWQINWKLHVFGESIQFLKWGCIALLCMENR